MANEKKIAPKLSAEIAKKLEELTTTSARVRYLHSTGMARGDIARTLNIRYQWVRNVLITPLKKEG